jgi:hypothetical protein
MMVSPRADTDSNAAAGAEENRWTQVQVRDGGAVIFTLCHKGDGKIDANEIRR